MITFQDIIVALNNNNFNESEYETIKNICNNKINESSNEYYKKQMFNLLNNVDNNLKIFINSLNLISFSNKINDYHHSYNINFNYNHFKIILTHKVSFCSEFGGISKDNNINIIDIHQETCYNLWGDKMISKFINLLNLESNEENVKEMIKLMFTAYNINIYY
jgi:hypothetical protein